jgi:hypothetical protein
MKTEKLQFIITHPVACENRAKVLVIGAFNVLSGKETGDKYSFMKITAARKPLRFIKDRHIKMQLCESISEDLDAAHTVLISNRTFLLCWWNVIDA